VACTHCLHVEVTEESQENTEIMRRHEAHGRFLLLCKDTYWWNVGLYRNNAPTTTAGSHCHTGSLKNGGKIKICTRFNQLQANRERMCV